MAEHESIDDWFEEIGSLFFTEELVFSDGLAESASLHELEHEVELCVFEHFDESDNIWVGNFAENLNFLEKIAHVVFVHAFGLNNFDGNFFGGFDVESTHDLVHTFSEKVFINVIEVTNFSLVEDLHFIF